ncbi:MAG: hypothetical protein ACI9NY_001157 [Kiritimatiellia bacterium]|jgi:hypothetical protein
MVPLSVKLAEGCHDKFFALPPTNNIFIAGFFMFASKPPTIGLITSSTMGTYIQTQFFKRY